jgi:GH25 family lysozyme M1 (1,4-beta-N-acetylmuramidase)
VTMLHGCDVSTFQSPGLVDWTKQDFGIVRATYGTRPDAKTVQHVERIRAAGKVVGLYHFFRPDQNIDAQVEEFCKQAEACNLFTGDMLPCVDIEDYPDKFSGSTAVHWAPVAPAWVDTLARLVENLEVRFGGSILYVTQRDWHRLGKPEWVLERPLWVANYPGKGATSPLKAPATPAGKPWRIWQWLVGPLDKQLQDHTSSRAVDQNVATSPLPLIGDGIYKPEPTVEVAESIPYVLLSDDDWEDMRIARDEYILGMDEGKA